MRIVIVTGTQLHHRHLCSVLAERFEVVGILHPVTPRRTRALRRLVRRMISQGPVTAVSHAVAAITQTRRKEKAVNGPNGQADEIFGSASRYDQIESNLIHRGCDVST